MKRALIIIAVITLIVMLLASPLVFAQESQGTTQTTTTSDSVRAKFKTDLEAMKLERSAYKEARSTERAEALKTRTVTYAEKQINIRLKVLTEQERRLSGANCSKVTSVDVKTPIATAITTLRNDLNAALAKIKAAGTAEVARTELKSAIEKTRVFMYINPAISGLCRAGKILDRINDRFDPLIVKLKEKQVDTTVLEKELANAESSLMAAIDTYKKVLSNPSSTNNKDLLTSAKAQLKAARTSLSNFKTELAKIADELKADNNLRSNQQGETNSSSSEPVQDN